MNAVNFVRNSSFPLVFATSTIVTVVPLEVMELTSITAWEHALKIRTAKTSASRLITHNPGVYAMRKLDFVNVCHSVLKTNVHVIIARTDAEKKVHTVQKTLVKVQKKEFVQSISIALVAKTFKEIKPNNDFTSNIK